jgi:hypothetical protein
MLKKRAGCPIGDMYIYIEKERRNMTTIAEGQPFEVTVYYEDRGLCSGLLAVRVTDTVGMLKERIAAWLPVDVPVARQSLTVGKPPPGWAPFKMYDGWDLVDTFRETRRLGDDGGTLRGKVWPGVWIYVADQH